MSATRVSASRVSGIGGRATGYSFAVRLAAYRELGRIQFLSTLAYRTNYFFSAGILVLQIFTLRVVWTAVYGAQDAIAGSGGVGGISLSTQLSYATLASLQFWICNPWVNFLERRIVDGKIAVDILRPVGLIQQTLAGQTGATVALFPFALLALPFAIAIGGVSGPASPWALAGYVVSTLVAYATNLLLVTLVALGAFWTMEMTGPAMIFRLVSQVLSGALVPLWFMPSWLASVASLLPFQATTYTPVATYLGKISGLGFLQAFAVQLIWIVALWLLLRLVWSRALHRLVIQGG